MSPWVFLCFLCLQSLYGAGARRIVLAGLPPIGCLPLQVTTVGSIIPNFHMLQRVCVDQQNIDSKVYNNKLQALTSRLQVEYNGAKVLYVDIYNPIMDIIKNPHNYGKIYIYIALTTMYYNNNYYYYFLFILALYIKH